HKNCRNIWASYIRIPTGNQAIRLLIILIEPMNRELKKTSIPNRWMEAFLSTQPNSNFRSITFLKIMHLQNGKLKGLKRKKFLCMLNSIQEKTTKKISL